MVKPLRAAGVRAWSWVNALGSGYFLSDGRASSSSLREAFSAPSLTSHLEELGIPGYSGRVASELVRLPQGLEAYESRCARLMLHGLAPLESVLSDLRAEVGPLRIGIALGSSTGGIDRTEAVLLADRRSEPRPPHYDFDKSHPYHALLHILRAKFGIEGPAVVVSTACASGGKALATAQRWLHAGIVDVVLAGGVDALCELTVRGFAGLGVLSELPCSPFDEKRSGISIGEGAAFVLLERTPRGEFLLLGAGESGDAHHPTAPHPEGLGAALSVQRCLSVASVTASEIDYVNAHGTGTEKNDEMEAMALKAVLGKEIPYSSTKHKTGHQLGAAGATEALFCLEALREGWIPPQSPAREDPTLAVGPAVGQLKAPPRTVLSNSFAFGGSNVTVCLAKRKPPSGERSGEAQLGEALAEALPEKPAPFFFIEAVAVWPPESLNFGEFLAQASPEPGRLPPAEVLPARARGRASVLTRIFAQLYSDLRGSEQAPRFPTDEIPTVFASCYGEMETTVELLHQIGTSPTLSPLRFQASVHNTAAGQLSVATKNRAFSTSVAAGESTFAMGLLEAQCWLECHGGEILLLVADESSPATLMENRKFSPLGVGLHLRLGTEDEASSCLRMSRVTKERGRDLHPLRELSRLGASPSPSGIDSTRQSPVLWGLPLALVALTHKSGAPAQGHVLVGPDTVVLLGNAPAPSASDEPPA